MKHPDFQEIVDYLYSLLPAYQLTGDSALKKDLGNIEDLCWSLGRPQWKFHSIHVAGTNGKGSVSAMLSSILQEAGYKTGLYTSPHLQSFTERIKINGKSIPEAEVVEWVEAQKIIVEALRPSFFELTVAMAFSYFADQLVDIAVIEVGLGGRLDSTNIINPEIGIITNIDFDHQHILGNTRELIAKEKAGIIKPYTPIIIGETHPETTTIFLKEAAEKGAPIYFADQCLHTEYIKMTGSQQLVEVSHLVDKEEQQHQYTLDLLGLFQLQNLQSVLQAVEVLNEDGWLIPEEAVVQGLSKIRKNTGLRGRMEVWSKEPWIFCDTAHNEAGVEAMLQSIREMDRTPDRIVWGMVSEKTHERILNLLPKEAKFYFVAPKLPRAFPASSLMTKAKAVGIKGKTYPSVEKGIQEALSDMSQQESLLIGGSTFVVAEAIEALPHMIPSFS